jgi:hypothetical protein
MENIKDSKTHPSCSFYLVMSGIFKGHNFYGHEITINGEDRIWDEASIGRSFPKNDCKKTSVNK